MYLTECRENLRASSVELVQISSIVISGTPRSDGENNQHVRALVEVQEDLPPIVVHRATMRLIDGLHRLRAAELCGHAEIPVRFFDGKDEDAYLLSVALNVTHGLPLSSGDRIAAVQHILVVHPWWSDRAIAAAAGLSARRVSEIRKRLAGHIPEQSHRVGRDGKFRPIDSAKAREYAGELIRRDPDASLRAIARQAGISPATVANVRDRIRRGCGVHPVRVSQDPAYGNTDMTGLDDSGAAGGAKRTPSELLSMVQTLQKDPALRFNEVGRLMLRMFHLCALAAREQERIRKAVPPYCATLVSELFIGFADVWRSFAIELREKNVTA